jgi:phosphoketolase
MSRPIVDEASDQSLAAPVRDFLRHNPEAESWAAGYGVIRHHLETQQRVFRLAEEFSRRDLATPLFSLLAAADRVASAGMWLVVHSTYARVAHLDGRPLSAAEFKREPEGHTGGSLNMVPAYVGYMAANAIAGLTRSWLMGQGHCVAAVDAVNLLLGNMSSAHSERYAYSTEGIARYLQDFYSYAMGADGRQDSPLGSHVNAHTGGGLAEGGYLGFAELQYVHLPLPGERLVAFLSDGAYEEQRGSNWAPRWWRAEDCGVVTPIMISNGRRIDQRTTVAQGGGADWFVAYQKLNGFDPLIFDGRDPAAFVWAIFEMEFRLETAVEAIRAGKARYPVALPYGIALAPKGAGFFNEGTNLAHNLPLLKNPHQDAAAAAQFNESARRLWVPAEELATASRRLQNFQLSGRPREREHPLAQRDVTLKKSPPGAYRPVSARDLPSCTRHSPMAAIDDTFLQVVQANPGLRPRVGNPDEMRSNRMVKTLEALKFRVTSPEPGMPEDLFGAVITALNEEAVACAALANKGGINLIVTYEAFAVKMHGAVRQEITFAAQCHAAGRPPHWLSVPLVLTSHTWENGKNEFSHQDPVMAEVMLNEIPGFSRVLFLPDANTATAAMRQVYLTQGQVWTLVAPKADTAPDLFAEADATELVNRGAARLHWAGFEPSRAAMVLSAIGSYQLEQVLKASARLRERGIPHAVNYLLEPARFHEAFGRLGCVEDRTFLEHLFPRSMPLRLFVSHTRPAPLLGLLGGVHTGVGKTAALGFAGHGGTLTTDGMLFVNGCSWAHILAECARLLNELLSRLLSPQEIAVLEGKASPQGCLF